MKSQINIGKIRVKPIHTFTTIGIIDLSVYLSWIDDVCFQGIQKPSNFKERKCLKILIAWSKVRQKNGWDTKYKAIFVVISILLTSIASQFLASICAT